MTTPIKVESWIWYGAVVLMLGLRFIARFILLKDIRKFQTEDWFMVFVFCLYTILIVFLNICADVSTNLIEPDEIATLTPQDIKDRVYGSKCVLVVESMMCAVQWGVKACMLMLYYRLTENLGQRRVVKVAAGYCFVTYVVMISLYYGYWCRPFRAFWETPTPNIQCATQTHHLIVNLVFNLTSDLLIIFIPLPLFVKAHLGLKKKLLLIFPFSLGFFTMICAILSKHLSFTAPFSSEWIYWYTREASTAMIVSNMPYSWTIIRKVFRLKGFLSGSTGGRPDDRYAGRHHSGASVPTAGRTRELDAKSWPSKTFSFLRRDNRSHKQASETESTGAINDGPSTFNMEDWKDRDIDGKSDPFSSASSEVSKSAKDATNQTSGVADVDRLYRLDDDDLTMTSAQQQQRQQQHYTARSCEP